MTPFDVHERIPDLSFLSWLNVSAIAVSVPCRRWRELGDD